MAGGLIEDLRRGHHVSAGHYCAGVVELHLRRAPGSPGLEPQQHKPGVGSRVIPPHPPTVQLIGPWSKHMDYNATIFLRMPIAYAQNLHFFKVPLA